MEYPIHILPRKQYKNISDPLSDNFLIRHFILDNKDTKIYDINNQIENKFLFDPTEKFGDLSTSLLGIFNIDDINVNLTLEGKLKYLAYCNDDFDFDVPSSSDFFIDNNEGLRKFWTVQIKNINNTTHTFVRANETKESTFTCHVLHTPAKWNFWHYSIRWFLNDEQEYYFKKLENKEITSGNKKRIATSVRKILKENVLVNNDIRCEIPSDCYLFKKDLKNFSGKGIFRKLYLYFKNMWIKFYVIKS